MSRPSSQSAGRPQRDTRIPSGGSIAIADSQILDASGAPMAGLFYDARIRVAAIDGTVLDDSGKPVCDCEGGPVRIKLDPRLPPGGSVNAERGILDHKRRPLLNKSGDQMRLTDPRVPPGGSIVPDGTILDASKRPVLGRDSKPVYLGLDSLVPPNGRILPDGTLLDERSKPVLDFNGSAMRLMDPRLPPGGSYTREGILLNLGPRLGRPILGPDSMPLVAYGVR